MQTEQTEWWESDGGFFGDLYKEADDSVEGHLNSPLNLQLRTTHEISGVAKLCGLNKGAKILDCPCGYGRHSLALAEAGFNVTGADINERFLKLDEDKRSEKKIENCRFIKNDMRHLKFRNEFDAVINMFYSFGFFDSDKENEEVARKFFEALKPGGKFLMHTHVTVPRLVSGELLNFQVRKLLSGKELELKRRYNTTTKREDGEWTLITKDGKREELTPYSVRLYTDKEFTDLCKGVGFKEVACYGDWDGSPYNDNSPQLITVATK
ncbi:MAG: class I SAM-dependent methyltransferase [Patescibacteria group bacterium]